MAIDTENKRRSVEAYTLGLMRPVPDSVVTMPDRATVIWLYSGLDYSGGEPPSPVGIPKSGFLCNVGRLMGRGTMGLLFVIGIAWPLIEKS